MLYRWKMNLTALKFRDFRLYLFGNLFSLNALWMQRVIIGWIAWDLTASATFVGFIAFLNYAPAVIAGPFFGVLIDRVRIKKAAKVTQFCLFVIAIGFYLFFVFGILDEISLSALSLLSGLVTSAHHPVRLSLAPRLVNRGAVTSVVPMVAINFNLARLTGPAIGGFLIAVWGVEVALIVQVFLYLPFIFAIGFLHPRQRETSKTETEPFATALYSGLQHTLANDLIRQALAVTFLYSLLIRGTLEILPVIADGVFAKGATGLGLLISGAGFGALVAGTIKVFSPSQKAGELPKFATASALLGIAFIPLIGLSNIWALTFVYICYLGFSATYSGISIQTAVQMDLPDSFRGRVMSIWTMINIGASAAGAMVLGAFADYVGISVGLSLAGGIGITLFIILLIHMARTKKDTDDL
ncbi:MAG: hypothetical protein CML56_07155 [Rhodobacteraceae bacterium]|nr:hypothetical protein [Paracoccaceae bacterium]